MPKLTKRYIDGIRYKGDGSSRDVRWDGAMPGFGLPRPLRPMRLMSEIRPKPTFGTSAVQAHT